MCIHCLINYVFEKKHQTGLMSVPEIILWQINKWNTWANYLIWKNLHCNSCCFQQQTTWGSHSPRLKCFIYQDRCLIIQVTKDKQWILHNSHVWQTIVDQLKTQQERLSISHRSNAYDWYNSVELSYLKTKNLLNL